LDPYSKHYVTLVVTETLATLVAVASAYALTRAWQERTPGWWAVTGALAAPPPGRSRGCARGRSPARRVARVDGPRHGEARALELGRRLQPAARRSRR